MAYTKSFSQPVDINGRLIKSLKTWKENNPKKLVFDSKFELDCYKMFHKENFNFSFHPETREVMPGFNSWALSKGQTKKIFKSKVRSINYTSDFAIYCNNGVTIFVEAKGFFHKDARMRYKLFQSSLKENELSILVFDKKVAKSDNLGDIRALIRIVKDEFGGSKALLKKVEEKREKITKI
jgi:hypothetical protein